MQQLFPIVAERLQLQGDPPGKDQVTFKEYLTHISQLHQCLSMALQLQVAACCSVLQRVAVCCSVLQRVIAWYSVLQCT